MTAVEVGSWFEPLPKQQLFIADWRKETAYVGGFGSGKTLAGGFKALAVSLAYPGTVGLVARQTHRALEDTTEKILIEGDDKPPVIPPDLVPDDGYQMGRKRVILRNGSEILFRSFQDWNEEKLRSLNLGWVYMDEATEATEKLWLALLGRLRHPVGPRIAWLTSNPNGHDWVWRRFHPDSGQAVGELVHAPTEENTYLTPDYLAWLRSQPREWQKRFVDASFDTATGMIWDEWNRHVHVVPEFELDYQWAQIEALDHGRRNPTAVLWAAVDNDGNLIVFDGYYSPGLVSQHAAAITLKRGARKYGPIVSDPQVFTRGFDGRCVADEYAQHGIDLTQANNEVGAGLLRVSEWLTRRAGEPFPDWHPWAGTLGEDGQGAPRLYVIDTPGTQDLRREIAEYKWRDLSPTAERDRDQPEEPRKKDDHACDALRYLVMANPRPWTPAAVPDPEAKRRARAITAGLQDEVF